MANRIISRGILLGLLFIAVAFPNNASAQAPKWLAIIGDSAAARNVIAGIAESGGPAVRSALATLGIRTASDTEAFASLSQLSSAQRSALILHDTKLGGSYLSQFRSDPNELKV